MYKHYSTLGIEPASSRESLMAQTLGTGWVAAAERNSCSSE